MRIVGLTLVIAFLSGQLMAQELQFEKVDKEREAGVVVHDQSQMSVAYFFEEQAEAKGDSLPLTLVLISPDLHEIHRTRVSVEKGAEGLQVCFSGEFYFLHWKHRANRSRTYLSMDQEGREVFREAEENLSREQLDDARDPLMVAMDPQQVLLIRRIPSSGGLEMMALNRELNSPWTEKVEPVDRQWILADYLMQEDRMFFLMNEKDKNGRQDGSQLLAISLHDGKEVFRARIEGGAETRAEMIRLMGDGNIYCAGSLVDPQDEELDGLFYTYVSLDGRPYQASRFHWNMMPEADSLSDVVEGLIKGNQHVRIREILQDDQHEIHLLGEIFLRSDNAGVKSRKSAASGSGTRILLGDLVLVHLGPDGSMRGVKAIQREPIAREVKGLPASLPGHVLSQWLASEQAFSVLPYAGSDITKGYFFRQWEMGNPHLCYRSLKDTVGHALECAMLTRQPGTEDSGPVAGRAPLDYSSPSKGSWDRFVPEGFLPLRHGQFLFYERKGSGMEVWKHSYSAK